MSKRPKPAPRFVDPIAHLSPRERRKLPVNFVGGLRALVPAPTVGGPASSRAVEKKPRPIRKNNPKRVSAARELRDRYLEAVNADPSMLLPSAKYDLARAVGSDRSLTVAARPEDARGSLPEAVEVKALPEAA